MDPNLEKRVMQLITALEIDNSFLTGMVDPNRSIIVKSTDVIFEHKNYVDSLINSFLRLYPELNGNWLFSGEGEMFTSPFNVQSISDGVNERVALIRHFFQMSRVSFASETKVLTISNIEWIENYHYRVTDFILRCIVAGFPMISRIWLYEGRGEMFIEGYIPSEIKSGVGNRINLFCTQLGLSVFAFGRNFTHLTKQNSMHWMSYSKLDYEHIDLICVAFPEVNRTWLITGEGEMFIKDYKNLPIADDAIDRLRNLRKCLKLSRDSFNSMFKDCPYFNIAHLEIGKIDIRPIHLYDICKVFHDVNENWLFSGEGPMFKTQ